MHAFIDKEIISLSLNLCLIKLSNSSFRVCFKAVDWATTGSLLILCQILRAVIFNYPKKEETRENAFIKFRIVRNARKTEIISHLYWKWKTQPQKKKIKHIWYTLDVLFPKRWKIYKWWESYRAFCGAAEWAKQSDWICHLSLHTHWVKKQAQTGTAQVEFQLRSNQ